MVDCSDRHELSLEIFEWGKVSLTLTGTDFEARPGAVTVAIPLDLWQRLREVEIDSSVCWRDDDEPPARQTIEEA